MIEHINHAWAAILIYIKLRGGEFVYLAVVRDVNTRIIRGWALLRSLAAELNLSALVKDFTEGLAESHHSDQGVQNAGEVNVVMLAGGGCKSRWPMLGTPSRVAMLSG